MVFSIKQRNLIINFPLIADFLGDVMTPFGSDLNLLLEWDLINFNVNLLSAGVFLPDIVGTLQGTLTWNARRWIVIIDANEALLLHPMSGSKQTIKRSEFWTFLDSIEQEEQLGNLLERLIKEKDVKSNVAPRNRQI